MHAYHMHISFLEEMTVCIVIVRLLCLYFPLCLPAIRERRVVLCVERIGPFFIPNIVALGIVTFIGENGAAITEHFNELVPKLYDVEVHIIQERCILHIGRGYKHGFIN